MDLSPNQQTDDNVLDHPDAAGQLVCRDNTVEVAHSCANHGGYLSIIFLNRGLTPERCMPPSGVNFS